MGGAGQGRSASRGGNCPAHRRSTARCGRGALRHLGPAPLARVRRYPQFSTSRWPAAASARLPRSVLALRRERGERKRHVPRLGMIDERDMAECLAEFLAIPLAGPGDYPAAVQEPAMRGNSPCPGLTQETSRLVLAMADPTANYALKADNLATAARCCPGRRCASELKAALARLYGASPLANGAMTATEAARDDVRRLAGPSPTKNRRSATSTG